jgi:hypothetical protein
MLDAQFIIAISSLNTFYLHRRKKPGVKEPLPKRAKVSPATVPPTPDAPIPSPIHDDIHM